MITYKLYIKESPLGLKYLGATTRNPYLYKGSGKYWKRHLKANNFGIADITTIIIFSTEDKTQFDYFCNKISTELNVVESNEFANLMPETGIDSTIGRICTEETRLKIANSNKGRVPTKETILKIQQNRKPRLNYSHSQETRDKISKTRIERKYTNSPETLEKMKAKTKGSRLPKLFVEVHKYDLNGNFLESFPSLTDAHNVCKCDVFNAASGRHKLAGGFLWSKIKTDTIQAYKPIIYNYKPIKQYSLDGIFIREWPSYKAIFNELGFKRTAILNCAGGLTKTSNGYKWTY